MQKKELSQLYYRRKLSANKLKRLINSERRKIKLYLALIKLFSIVLICILGIFILKLPQWHINQNDLKEAKPWVLKLEGNVITPDYKIIDMIRQTELKDVAIYRLNIKGLEKNIANLEAINKVYVRRFWLPARLFIKIEERVPVFVIAPNNETPPISAVTMDGVFIGRDYMPLSTRFKTTKILSYGIKGDDYENWDKARVEELSNFVKAIETYSKQQVVYLDLRKPKDVYIQLSNYLVRFGEINSTAHERAKSLSAIIPEIQNIGEDIQYIDLSWEVSRYLTIKNKSGKTVTKEN